MPDRRIAELVKLDQGEGRARHRLDAAARADEGAGEAGLAGAKLAFERDHVARPGQRRDARGERRRGGFIGQLDDDHYPRLVYLRGEGPQYLPARDASAAASALAPARRRAKLARCGMLSTAVMSRSSARGRWGCLPPSNAACSTWAFTCSTPCRRPAGNAPRSIRKSRSTTFPAIRESAPPSWSIAWSSRPPRSTRNFISALRSRG